MVENKDMPESQKLTAALKEWAVTVRALREGRQVFLLRKGGILDSGSEFPIVTKRVLLFPTYLHEDEQKKALQPCYTQWLDEENRNRPTGENIRLTAWADITDTAEVTNPDALYRLSSQHIHSDDFLRYRIEHDTRRPLFALFVRVWELPMPVDIPIEPGYYGCKSWIYLENGISLHDSRPAMGESSYSERVRVIKARLTDDKDIEATYER